MSVVARRLVRLARTGSPGAVLRAARRELDLRRSEASLDEGLAGTGPVVVGPFVGEVGYELLYWRPFVLRLLRGRGIDPARVTVIGRGGSSAWYGGVAARAIDVFDLVTPDAVRQAAERRRFGSPKQLEADELDAELLAAAGLADGATVIHPSFMYWRLRHLWEGTRPAADAPLLADYDSLPRTSLPSAIEAVLPEEFVAVKAYFNEGVPDEPAVHGALGAVVEALARRAPVVLLSTPVAADTHGNWEGPAEVIEVAGLLDPSANLAQQVEIVARSRALVSTYGGFSYAGPFLGVPTVAFAAGPEDNPRHEQVLRAAWPQAPFVRVPVEADAVLRSLDA